MEYEKEKMKIERGRLALVFLILFAVRTFLSFRTASAGVIYVNTSGWWIDSAQFNASSMSIPSAIINVTDGDLIYVYNGSYNENVIGDKSLTLEGESSATSKNNITDNTDAIRLGFVSDSNVVNNTVYRYVSSTGLFEKCAHFEGLGWWPATGSESFTMLESGRGYRVMAEDDCLRRHEKNTVEIAFAELKAQELSKSFWAGIQRMSAEEGRYKSTQTIRR